MLKHKRYHLGFTLAETLITIGIIGIVASLTIPKLITAYQKYDTGHKLKQTYAIFSQALKLSIAENGDPDGWDYTRASYSYDFEKYILPYLKYSQISRYPDPKTLYGYSYLYWVPKTNKIYQLHNGTRFVMMRNHNATLDITVDINGSKGPNILGTDVFVFYIKPDNSLGSYNLNDNYNNRLGMRCTNLVQKNNWKIPKAKDYRVNGKPCWYTDK